MVALTVRDERTVGRSFSKAHAAAGDGQRRGLMY
jgi:hypothetical protein